MGSRETRASTGEVTFHDCRDVDVLLDGGSDDAGFVQIMQGRAKDQADMRSRQSAIEPALREVRPDLLGGTIAWHGDGAPPVAERGLRGLSLSTAT